MGTLVNELSWSVSRNSLFSECRRAYYYNYYGSWGGWEANTSATTRKFYILKNLKTLDMWAGGVVHETIAEALRRYSLKPAPILGAELQATARQKMRGGWLEAVNREWEKSPKRTNLAELYYGNGRTLPPEQTERIKDKVNNALAAFADSEVLRELLAATYLTWKPVDKLDSFLLEGGKVWCAVDFAYTDASGRLRILDWKTGGENEESLQLQLACYAFFAGDKWLAPPEQVRVFGVFLRDGARAKEYSLDPAVLVDAKDRILTSMAEMRAVLSDVTRNEAQEENFPFCAADYPCRRCNFREVCPRVAANRTTGAAAPVAGG